MEKTNRPSFFKRAIRTIGLNRIMLVGVLILLYFLFSWGSGRLLSEKAVRNVFNTVDWLGFLALGVTFVIATGGIDFSIGPVMFCAGLIGGQLLVGYNWPLVVCMLICILVGMVFGTLNGIMVAYMGLPSFISSMASMMLAKGVGSVFTHTQMVSWPGKTKPDGWYKKLINWDVPTPDFLRNLFRLEEDTIRIPTGIIILLIVAIICAIILNKTKIGRYILCIGSNREAVRLSGVDTRKWEMLAYIICGTLAGIAAIPYVGVNTVFSPGLGDEFNNNAIASSVMGGTSMAGGVASISGSIIGAMIISLLSVGLNAMKFSPDYQYIISGAIVAVAVFADIRSSRRRR